MKGVASSVSPSEREMRDHKKTLDERGDSGNLKFEAERGTPGVHEGNVGENSHARGSIGIGAKQPRRRGRESSRDLGDS